MGIVDRGVKVIHFWPQLFYSLRVFTLQAIRTQWRVFTLQVIRYTSHIFMTGFSLHSSLSVRAFLVGLGWLNELGSWTHANLLPIRRGFTPGFVNYKIGWTRLAAASDKVYQLLVQGRWFSPGTPASSTTKTGRHDIAEILLKVALNTNNQIFSCTTKSGRPNITGKLLKVFR
jgi:hypothetical protein